jgi:hypothetical protein
MGSSRCATPRSRRRHVKSVPNSEPWSVWMRLVLHKRISRAVATEREAIDLVRYFKRLGLAGLTFQAPSDRPRRRPARRSERRCRRTWRIKSKWARSGRAPRPRAETCRFFGISRTVLPVHGEATRIACAALRAQLYQIGARPFPETRRSGDWVSPTLERCSHRFVGVHRDRTRARARPGRAPSAEYRVAYNAQAERDDRPLVSALVAGLLVTVPFEVAGPPVVTVCTAARPNLLGTT